MLYFSEIFGKKVFDKEGAYIGKLHDLLFLPIETPLVTKFVVQDKHKKEIIIPANVLKKYNGKEFIITTSFEPQKRKEDEASLLKNVQDKQILDLKGENVIRANDIAIQDQQAYAIAGIDIGILGVFRWIGVAKFAAKLLRKFGIRYKSDFLPWDQVQPLESTNGKIVLKQEKEKLKKLQPEDLADYLEKTTTVNALKILKLMDPEQSAQVIGDINVGFQADLFGGFSSEKGAEILSLMDPDEAVDIILTLSQEKREEILPLITPKKKKPIVYLLKHAKTPIGNLMTTEYLTVNAGDTVKIVIDKIRKKTTDFSQLVYIYAVNKENQITGVFNLHDLFIYAQDAQVYKFMLTNVVLVRLTTPKEIAVQKMLKYNIHSLPVVDEERRLLGIISLDDAAEDILEKVMKV